MSLIVMTVFLPKTKEIEETLKVSKIHTKISHAKWPTILSSFSRFWPAKKSWLLNWKAHFFKPRDSVPVRLSWQVWPGKIEGLVLACILRNLPIVLYICKLYNWTLCAEPFIFEQGVDYIGRGVVLRGIMGETFHRNCYYKGERG